MLPSARFRGSSLLLAPRPPIRRGVDHGRRHHRRGRRPGRPGRRRRVRRRGTQRAPGGPGGRAEPGRPGVLEPGRPVPGRQPRAAPDGHQGLSASWRGRTGWARPSSTGTRTAGRGRGPRPTWTSPRARSAPGCTAMGHRVFPVVGWAERGDGRADGHGNSVPRFHVTWGTGPGVVEPFERRVREHVATRQDPLRLPRTRSTASSSTRAAVVGVQGTVLAPDDVAAGRGQHPRGGRRVRAARRRPSSSPAAASAATTTWSARPGRERLGTPPRLMVAGVPAHVDGRMLQITQDAGANVINPDRMWHYVEGIRNWDPIWDNHGIRILPGPSSLWLDAAGSRLPAPYFPGFDTLGTLQHLRDRLRLLLVRPDPGHHREGVRALRLRAEPGPDRQGPQAPALPSEEGRAGTGGGVQAARRGLRRRRRPRRLGRGHEPHRRRRRAGPRRGSRATHHRRPRPRDRQQVHQGRPDHRHPRRPQATAATG